MAKVTTSYILLDEYGRAYNYKLYTREECIREYEAEFEDEDIEIHDYEPYVSYFRYLTKEEIRAEGDWEYISGYEDGSLQMFEECEPDDKGAFKCWVIGD